MQKAGITVDDPQGERQLALEVRKERSVSGRHFLFALRTHPVELIDDASPMPLHFVRSEALVVRTLLLFGYQPVLLQPLAQICFAAARQQRLDGGLEKIRIAANTRHRAYTSNLDLFAVSRHRGTRTSYVRVLYN